MAVPSYSSFSATGKPIQLMGRRQGALPSWLQSRYGNNIGTDILTNNRIASGPIAPWGPLEAEESTGRAFGWDPKVNVANFDITGGLKPLVITKDAEGASAGNSLLSAFNRYAGQMPDFNAMMKGLQGKYDTAQSNLDAAYNEQQAALNPNDWINARRKLDANLGDLTGRYEADLGKLRGEYSDVLGGYDKSGRALVDEILTSGQRYIDTIIPQQRNLALSKALTYLDKYGIQNAGAGGGTGASSGGATLAGRAVSDAMLPYMAEAEKMQQELRRNVALPFESEMANRYIGKLTGFDYPVTSDIYNRYGAVNTQQRATEDAIYSAKQAASAGKVQSAIGQLMSAGLSVQQMAQILQLPISLISQQAQALSQILGVRNIATEYGTQDPMGANVTMPYNPGLSRPAPYQPDYSDFANRYNPSPVSTQTGVSPTVPGYQSRYPQTLTYVPKNSGYQMPIDYYDNNYGPNALDRTGLDRTAPNPVDMYNLYMNTRYGEVS